MTARQAPLSLGFSSQDYWSGLPWPFPGDLLDPGIEPGSPTLQGDSLPSVPPGKHQKTPLHWVAIPFWRRQWHPTPVLLPGKSHGWKSLVGCSPWDHEESDMIERLHFHASEKEMATHSRVLAWRIPGTAERGGLPSTGSHRVRHGWSDLAAIPFSRQSYQSRDQTWVSCIGGRFFII